MLCWAEGKASRFCLVMRAAFLGTCVLGAKLIPESSGNIKITPGQLLAQVLLETNLSAPWYIKYSHTFLTIRKKWGSLLRCQMKWLCWDGMLDEWNIPVCKHWSHLWHLWSCGHWGMRLSEKLAGTCSLLGSLWSKCILNPWKWCRPA